MLKLTNSIRSGLGFRAIEFFIDIWIKVTNPQYRLLVRARRDRDVRKSREIVDQLKFKYPNSSFWNRHLSVIAADLGLTTLAKDLGRDYFQSVINADLDDLLDDVRGFLEPVLGEVTIEYSYRGGNENIGCLICKASNGMIVSFGKVINLQKKSSREVHFYETIRENYPRLESVVPKCFGVFSPPSENLAIIFLDLLDPQGLEKKRIGVPVIEINSVIESVSYADAEKIFLSIPVDSSKPFGRIFHLKHGCKYALTEIRRGFLKSPSFEVEEILHALELIFLHADVHRYIDIKKHYSLCHNDFHWRNLYYCDGDCKVFDWGTYSIGMRGWDMATYFSDGEFSFEEISRLYLNKEFDLHNRKDQVVVLFFCFSLMLILSRRHRRNCESLVQSFFRPALILIQDMHKRLTGA